MKTKKDRQILFKEVKENIITFWKMTDGELDGIIHKRFSFLSGGTREEKLEWLVVDELGRLEERF